MYPKSFHLSSKPIQSIINFIQPLIHEHATWHMTRHRTRGVYMTYNRGAPQDAEGYVPTICAFETPNGAHARTSYIDALGT